MKSKILVLGVGNPILGDDGVGVQVSRLLRERLDFNGVDIQEAYVGGLHLAECTLGYETVYIIDATSLNGGEEGEIVTFKTDELGEALHLTNPHDLNFTTAISLVKQSEGEKTPKLIKIFGIRIKQVNKFSESLTPKISKAAQVCTKTVLHALKKEIGDFEQTKMS